MVIDGVFDTLVVVDVGRVGIGVALLALRAPTESAAGEAVLDFPADWDPRLAPVPVKTRLAGNAFYTLLSILLLGLCC